MASMVKRIPSRSQPTWTSRVTPTARARLDRVGDVERLVTLARDVEVDVVVDDVDGQRVRQPSPAGPAAPTRAGSCGRCLVGAGGAPGAPTGALRRTHLRRGERVGVVPRAARRAVAEAGALVLDDLLGVELDEDAGRLGDRASRRRPDATPTAASRSTRR